MALMLTEMKWNYQGEFKGDSTVFSLDSEGYKKVRFREGRSRIPALTVLNEGGTTYRLSFDESIEFMQKRTKAKGLEVKNWKQWFLKQLQPPTVIYIYTTIDSFWIPILPKVLQRKIDDEYLNWNDFETNRRYRKTIRGKWISPQTSKLTADLKRWTLKLA